MIEKIIGQRHFRTVPIVRENINSETRTIPMSFSSETPVVRYWGIEVLKHDPSCVRMNRCADGLPYLMDHNPRDQRGRIENVKLEGGKISGDVRLSRHARGEELWMDHVDGIRKETSMGYVIHAARELKPEEMTEEQKEIALRENLPVIECTSWEPLEGSSVSIPADSSVGMGRGADYYDGEKAEDVVKRVSEIIQNSKSTISVREDKTMEPTVEELQKRETERVAEIERISDKFKERVAGGAKMMEEMKRSAIDLSIPIETFRGTVYSRVTDTAALETRAGELDMSAGEKKQYSLVRLIQSQIPGSKEKAEFEMECSREVEKKLGRAARGFFVPEDIYRRESAVPPNVQRELNAVLSRYGISHRDLTVGTNTAGGHLKGTNLQASSFIEMLRNKLVATRVGVKFLPGLVGDVAIPKQDGAGSFGWVAENSATSETNQTFAQVTLSPKTGGAFTDISRQLILQSTPAIEGLIQEDLVKVCGLGVDLAVFHGTAANNQPRGIENVSGVGSVTGTDFDWVAAVEFESDVEGANADAETMYFVMRPADKGTLKTRLKAANTAVYLIGDDNMLNGYPVVTSNQITAGKVFFGDFSQAIVGEWGGVDILVDPYTASSAGTVRVTAFVSVDVAVRHAGAFSVCTTLT